MAQVRSNPSSDLVSTDWLMERLDDPKIRVVEVSFSPDDTVYQSGHIPGAVWWNWKTALWDDLKREFPTPEEMARRLGAIGVSPDTTVVAYGTMNGPRTGMQWGTYAHWVLNMCGHHNVKVLDGTRKRWVLDGKPLTKEAPRIEPVTYKPGVTDKSLSVGRDDILANLGRPGRVLADVRSPVEYRGVAYGPTPETDHGAERMGRIPGAKHLPFMTLLNEDDTFKSPEELHEICSRAGCTPKHAEEIITYCRLSHRASLVWFVMKHILGYPSVRVYDGSWTEWGSLVGVPIER